MSDLTDERWYAQRVREQADEIERFEASVDKLVCLLAERDAEIERLQDRVEALEGVYLMARRYLFDPNWDTHRQNLVNALKKAATEQGESDE